VVQEARHADLADLFEDVVDEMCVNAFGPHVTTLGWA